MTFAFLESRFMCQDNFLFLEFINNRQRPGLTFQVVAGAGQYHWTSETVGLLQGFFRVKPQCADDVRIKMPPFVNLDQLGDKTKAVVLNILFLEIMAVDTKQGVKPDFAGTF